MLWRSRNRGGAFGAARAIGDTDLQQRAITVALRAAERPPQDDGVIDAGLCHGAAGLGHLFNKRCPSHGEERLGKQRDSGFAARSISDARPRNRRVPGVRSWQRRKTDVGGRSRILTGAAGISLALLAAATAIAPGWDRMLLVRVRCLRKRRRALQPSDWLPRQTCFCLRKWINKGNAYHELRRFEESGHLLRQCDQL